MLQKRFRGGRPQTSGRRGFPGACPGVRAGLVSLALCASLSPRAGCAEPVVIVLGEAIDRAEIAADAGAPDPVGRLYARLWPRLARHYREEQGLAARAAEVEELDAYLREFERRDRAQRSRKLAELDTRIAAESEAARRAWLEAFRAVLRRLAQRDAEQDAAPPPGAGDIAARLRPEIEAWKERRALYRQYGGVVAQSLSGPDPQGARLALIEDYERRGLLRFEDAGLRAGMLERLARPPAIVVPPAHVDFTPYWRLPIPPSYFADDGPAPVERRGP